jgi:hypothetical protein
VTRLHEDEISCIRLDADGHVYFGFQVATDEFWMLPSDIVKIANKLSQRRLRTFKLFGLTLAVFGGG